MKNKVNVGKLIREKYKDNTLELPDLFEEIDLVLKETYQNYSYKHNLTDIQPVGETRDIAKHVNGNTISSNGKESAPRHEISTDINGNIKGHNPVVGPTVYAEAGEQSSGQQVSGENTKTVKVPDLFSLITNQDMNFTSDDKKMIDDIVANIAKGDGQNWITRVQQFEKYINEQKQGAQLSGQASDFRVAISKLIFLSLLKKLGFMTAQPGKLFEYVMAPLIGPNAAVVGSKDQEIIDIFRDDTGYPYSLKLFTGEVSNFVISGSRDKLFKYFGRDKETIQRLQKSMEKAGVRNPPPPGVTPDTSSFQTRKGIVYIICVADQAKRELQFCEVTVTSDMHKQWFEQRYPDIVGEHTDGQVRTRKEGGVTSYGVMINTQKADKKTVASRIAAAKEKQQQTQQPEKPKIPETVNILGKEISTQARDSNSFTKIIQTLNDFVNQPNQTKLIKVANLINSFEDKQSNQELANALKNNDAMTAAKLLANILQAEKDKIFPPKQQELQEQGPEKSGTEVPIYSDEEEIDSQQPDKLQKFNVIFKKYWTEAAQIKISIGDPSAHNEWQMNIAKGVQESMVQVLNSFDSLGKNMTQYFGTSIDIQKEKTGGASFGQACVNDAQNIVDGVIKIGASENETIAKK